jgi:ketosteroid isomerase-like protein
MRCIHRRLAAPGVLCVLLTACAPAPPSEADVIAVLEAFYSGIKAGDPAAVMALVAPDAMFVESGRLETREEYEKNHLPADIDFESQVAGTRGPVRVTFQGNDTAWVIATTEYNGTFQEVPVNFVGAQLMVLTRDDAGAWRIRSIHWSSRRL